MMRLIESGKRSAQELMDKDASLLETLQGETILHLYEMEGRSATYGVFSKPEQLLNMQVCAQEKIQLAKRPTGGGILFHFLDLAFSYLIPHSHPLFSENTLQNYHTVNRLVMKSLQELLPEKEFSFLDPGLKRVSSFCMAHPTAYDLLCERKKLAGAAQRRTKRGLLHQGSISILKPPLGLLEQLLGIEVAKEMEQSSFYLTEKKEELPLYRQKIASFLLKHFDL